jgi:hypothetical protein
MQTFLKPFKKLAGRVLLGLKPLALRARGFKPNKTLLLVFKIVQQGWSLAQVDPFHCHYTEGKMSRSGMGPLAKGY